MNPIKKVFLYPLAVTAVIIFVASLNWLLTWFFSIIFNTSVAQAAESPLLIIYVISVIACLYLNIFVCQYIDEEL